jgi:hypothetical protein
VTLKVTKKYCFFTFLQQTAIYVQLDFCILYIVFFVVIIIKLAALLPGVIAMQKFFRAEFIIRAARRLIKIIITKMILQLNENSRNDLFNVPSWMTGTHVVRI